jgi:hypothetical protein
LFEEIRSYCSLAFDDDTLFICEERDEFNWVMNTIDHWCILNGMEINKKKWGVLIVNSDQQDWDSIQGYPVVTDCKYLGVRVNSKMNPSVHIIELNKKSGIYFKRHFMLMKKYFPPKSLIRLVDYFVKSRLSYGLCCFLENNSII